jgi:aryl-alcohol dehydrogenase-like predicted oxidoreductase
MQYRWTRLSISLICRFLGNTGLRVSALSLGGWVTYGGQVGEDLALKCMDEAWKNGINFFDTAEVYADGKCEIAMGKAIKTLGWKREDFVISTKLFWGIVGPIRPAEADLGSRVA